MSVRMIDMENDAIYSPTVWRERSRSGRATCRVCGEKIKKGSDVFGFYHCFDEVGYTCWTSIECKVHAVCMLRHHPDMSEY